ncbi:MAG: beta-propeller domain-containing protein [Halanaeroarchaeum sp.]
MHSTRSTLLALLVVASSIGAVGLAASDPSPPTPPAGTAAPEALPADVQPFNSSADFAAYREAAVARYGADAGLGHRVYLTEGVQVSVPVASFDASAGAVKRDLRVSNTNVQETGIHEPDLVKTDGEYAYYSPRRRAVYGEREDGAATSVVDLRPRENASVAAEIDDAGRLLRYEDTLVVLGGDAVTGYSVADPRNPDQVWNRTLDGRVVSARLADGQLYLVIADDVASQPCPVEPLEGVSTPCTSVYHPDSLVPVETTYTVVRMDPTTGETHESVAFVGSRDSTVYVSANSLYLATTSPPARGHLLLEFLLAEARDVLPDDAVAHLEDVRSYDLSDRAIYAEADHVLDRYLASLSEERRREVRRTLADRYRAFTADRLRELTTTHVTAVALPSLEVTASGSVPGSPLDQFAMDEHEGTLRIATTVSAPRLRWEGANTSNDVYVLNESLGVIGSVQGMSDGQRVFGVRFVGDTGYVVTYRRVDPLHVIDLSNPRNPVERGSLKLPGFSGYLHPLSGDRLLGIGEEDGRVKTVIFDVSDPTDPAIAESRVLDARYSAVQSSHHAFLLDERHDAFFLPTDRGGNVLSTEDLSTKGSYSVQDPQRAVFVGNTLYVFGRHEVVVVDETTWNRVHTVPL